MVIPKIAVCPICGKKTYLRIEDGGYLDYYPIRVNCLSCHALIKGIYQMSESPHRIKGVTMFNARLEDCDVDPVSQTIKNADYVAEISGELPTKKVKVFDGHIITTTPFLEASNQIDPTERIKRLSRFKENMSEWIKWKSIAFQLLNDGNIESVGLALKNRMGDYAYRCDNYLKTLQCLQTVVLDETDALFFEEKQDDVVLKFLHSLSGIDRGQLHTLVDATEGIENLLSSYKKVIEVFSRFMEVYPNILPAETYMRYTSKNSESLGISSCSFVDIKMFYQDAYETVLSLWYYPVCIDNILLRGDYLAFEKDYRQLFNQFKFKSLSNDYHRYIALDNGMKVQRINNTEPTQGTINLVANKDLRNGIGHNNVHYDGISQKIAAFDLKNTQSAKYETYLIDMAVDCLSIIKSAVLLSELILFILRQELQAKGIQSIIHPKYYKNIGPNDKCPCGSNKKYKKCCKEEIEFLTRL